MTKTKSEDVVGSDSTVADKPAGNEKLILRITRMKRIRTAIQAGNSKLNTDHTGSVTWGY